MSSTVSAKRWVRLSRPSAAPSIRIGPRRGEQVPLDLGGADRVHRAVPRQEEQAGALVLQRGPDQPGATSGDLGEPGLRLGGVDAGQAAGALPGIDQQRGQPGHRRVERQVERDG
jgi:hypothetical protein